MSPSKIGLRPASALAALIVVLLCMSGCQHEDEAQLPPASMPPEEEAASRPAPAPPRPPAAPAPPARAPEPRSLARIPVTPAPAGGVNQADLEFISTHQPIATQTGYATWYTAPYKGRKAADGEVFDDSAMTAAHRTLPMGSLVRVTNLETGQSTVLRITDRGPFVPGRILDLTIAAAKATGIYRTGMAQVRMDVYSTPKPITVGGRWCVQIGAFHSESDALRLKAQLQQEYPESNVIEFPGEKSFWVRIRPQGDDRALADDIVGHVHPSEGTAFLTRLD